MTDLLQANAAYIVYVIPVQSSTCRKQQCSDEFLRFCQRMLTDLQSRIRKSRERLALTQNPDALPPTATEQQREAHELMNKLTDRIDKLIGEAETAGCDGEVEEVSEQFR